MNNEIVMQKYFERLSVKPQEHVTADSSTLRTLHMRHVMMIPYENKDYLTGNIKSADFETQFEEVIIKKRGGVCLDVNPLFGEFLKMLGFEVKYYSTVMCSRPAEDLNFHVILQVGDCDGNLWWCDVANPIMRFIEPLPIKIGEEIDASGIIFRFEMGPGQKLILREKRENDYQDIFRIKDSDITVEDRNESKYGDRERFPQNAVFCKEVFSIGTPQGRRTLLGNMYTESYPGGLYRYECSKEMKPWAYSQFNLLCD